MFNVILTWNLLQFQHSDLILWCIHWISCYAQLISVFSSWIFHVDQKEKFTVPGWWPSCLSSTSGASLGFVSLIIFHSLVSGPWLMSHLGRFLAHNLRFSPPVRLLVVDEMWNEKTLRLSMMNCWSCNSPVFSSRVLPEWIFSSVALTCRPSWVKLLNDYTSF